MRKVRREGTIIGSSVVDERFMRVSVEEKKDEQG